MEVWQRVILRVVVLTLLCYGAGVQSAAGQAAEELRDERFSVRAMGGWLSGYSGEPTYLVGLGWRERPSIEIETILQVVPQSNREARMYMLGVHHSWLMSGAVASGGVRAGFLDGPVYDGYIAHAVTALEVGRGSLSLRLEPGLWFAVDESIGTGWQIAAGIVWHID